MSADPWQIGKQNLERARRERYEEDRKLRNQVLQEEKLRKLLDQKRKLKQIEDRWQVSLVSRVTDMRQKAEQTQVVVSQRKQHERDFLNRQRDRRVQLQSTTTVPFQPNLSSRRSPRTSRSPPSSSGARFTAPPRPLELGLSPSTRVSTTQHESSGPTSSQPDVQDESLARGPSKQSPNEQQQLALVDCDPMARVEAERLLAELSTRISQLWKPKLTPISSIISRPEGDASSVIIPGRGTFLTNFSET